MKRFIQFLLVMLLLLPSLLSTIPVFSDDDFTTTANSALVFEQNTGKILFEKNADKLVGIASISKLLTSYVVLDAIQAGELDWSTKVPIKDFAYQLTVDSSSSNVPMEDREYTVEELLHAMLLSSANSAAIALAEKVSGKEKDFVKRMEDKLDSLGIRDYKLYNSSGLNENTLNIITNGKNQENLMSANALGVMVYNLLRDHPEITEITEKSQAKFGKETIYATNQLIPNMPRFRNGVDGLKTGSSAAYGDSIIVSTTERGMRLVSIVLNVENPDQDPNARYNATISLLNHISRTFYANVLAAEGEPYEELTALIKDGKKSPIIPVAKTDAIFIQQGGSTADFKVKWETDPKGYQAPIKKGEFVGYLTYQDPEPIGKGYIQGQEPKFAMVSQEEVDRSNFFKVLWNNFVLFVNEKL
ncbi:D-alanyl-D-alanine carboxypeptidase [Streptococcus danieliae]|uniref:D-alanyl-D-alanine carboxypeptidase n=1 Tax=Streptococcus danieliae TaxID=747656 RepID=UPI001843B871|nr:D-alanyl-D-alanine carboxypeptidase [Streptococcus danieliae]MCU0081980.1 D-alanyl-D-alanine carboxypeptidase [Streptococcus danieliae]NYS32754.1 D-alanyl-D-alanine carboxypeptidase [Streptococcus danieliae]